MTARMSSTLISTNYLDVLAVEEDLARDVVALQEAKLALPILVK